jgi:hypothetical protein
MARHFAIEGPIAEGGAVGEAAFDLAGGEIDAHDLRRALAEEGDVVVAVVLRFGVLYLVPLIHPAPSMRGRVRIGA